MRDLALSFSKQAAEELETKEETVRRELGELWPQLERLQDEQIEKTLTPVKDDVPLSAEERAAALELLRDPRLLERVLEDFDRCGVVGEETNKRIAYLAAVSRLLEKPLAIVVQSSSSAGKSSLMEAVLDFMPEEQRESYTAMTGQALFYMGQKNLKHKILAIAEQQGAERASYPLKLLQSEGKLNIASTGKDPVSGKHVTHEYVVEGPVMLFLTTTAHEVDEELLNRCIALTVNEEREQTRAIHRKQREARTTEGLWARRKRSRIVQLHRNAQRFFALRGSQQPRRRGSELSRSLDPDAARSHETADADRRHCPVAPVPAGDQDRHARRRDAGIHRGHRRGREAGAAIDAPGAGAVARRVADRTRGACWVDRGDGPGQECERQQIESREYSFHAAHGARIHALGRHAVAVHLRRLEEMEYLRVRRGGPGQAFVYQLASAGKKHIVRPTARGQRATARGNGLRGCSRGHFAVPQKTKNRQHRCWLTPQLRGIPETLIRGPRPANLENPHRTSTKAERQNGHGLHGGAD